MDIKSSLKNIFTTLSEKVNALYHKIPFQYLLLIIAAIIILISALIFISFNEIDDIPPTLEVITKDVSVYEGDTVTIEVNFSDNDKVSSAKIFYKKASEMNFSSKSIRNKTAIISIPLGSGEDWEYYVVVDDPSGNGPIGDPSTNGSITYDILVLKKDGGNNDSPDDSYQRYVFIEECSAESCHNCPDVAKRLHALFESGKYNFHYVTLIEEDADALNRMQEYNVEAYPVVFVDGGYKVYLGKKDKATYENAIQSAFEREPANIEIHLTTSYDETDNDIDITIKIINKENTAYKGRLKVYLAENVSTKYQDANQQQYKHAFLEFAMNKEINIPANSNKTESKTIDGNTFDPENLLVYAVIFSDEKHEKYQDPDQEKYAFNAYYVDACDGVQVVEGGNLPPYISISHPEVGKTYLRGKKVKFMDRFTFEQAVLIGKSNFTAQASDNDGIEKVELYIDGTLVETFTSKPYEYEYQNSKIFQFKHTIMFKAYDTKGKEASASIDIFAITFKAKS